MLKYRDYYVTCKEAAILLGFTAAHLRRLIIQGHIKAEKMGTTWVIPRKDLSMIRRRRFSLKKEDSNARSSK